MASRWTAQNVPDQSGRVAVVTGATGGLGDVVARELARHGARVIVGARDERRGREVRDALPGDGHEAYPLDLQDLDSVRSFASAVGEAHPRIDLLINNAGIMGGPRRLSAQGHELQFAVNHLGHFALTAGLIGPLMAAPGGRVVSVTSVLHRRGHLDFDDLDAGRRYSPGAAYNGSKLANALFGLELHRRLTAAGSSLSSVLAHPGYAVTNLQSRSTAGLQRFFLTRIGNRFIAQPAAQGALPLLYAATDPTARGGELIGPDGFNGLRGYPAVDKPAPQALDPVAARRLWSASEDLTGVTFEVPASA